VRTIIYIIFICTCYVYLIYRCTGSDDIHIYIYDVIFDFITGVVVDNHRLVVDCNLFTITNNYNTYCNHIITRLEFRVYPTQPWSMYFSVYCILLIYFILYYRYYRFVKIQTNYKWENIMLVSKKYADGLEKQFHVLLIAYKSIIF